MVGYMGTETAPSCCIPSSIKFHSGRLGEMIAILSSFFTPNFINPKLTLFTVSINSTALYFFHSPFTLLAKESFLFTGKTQFGSKSNTRVILGLFFIKGSYNC